MADRIKLVSAKAYKDTAEDDRAGLGILKVTACTPTKVKAEDADGDDLVLDWVISTGTVDREQDTIALDGWELDNFRKGGSVLWAHDYRFPLTVIARPSAVRVEGMALRSRAHYTPKDLNPFGFMQYQLARDGFLRASSVGLRIITCVENQERGGWWPLDIMTQELLEWSHVPVPANPEALVEATQRGIDVVPFRAWTEFQLDGEGPLLVPFSYLETLHKAIPGGAKTFDMGSAKAPDLGLELGIDGAGLLELLSEEAPAAEPEEEPSIEFTSRACPDCGGAGSIKTGKPGEPAAREKCDTCRGTGDMPKNYDEIVAARKAAEDDDEHHGGSDDEEEHPKADDEDDEHHGAVCGNCGSMVGDLAASLEEVSAALKALQAERAPEVDEDAQDDDPGEPLPVPGLRRAVLPITWSLVREAFGMPDGLDLVGCHVDPMTDTLVLFVDGECLQEIGPEETPPFVRADFEFFPDLDELLEDGTTLRTLRASWAQGEKNLADAKLRIRVHKSGAVDYTDGEAGGEPGIVILDPDEDQEPTLEIEE